MKKLHCIVLLSLTLLTGCASSQLATGLNNGQLLPCPDKPNCVNSMATDARHAIAPLSINSSTDEAKSNVISVLGKLDANNKIVVNEPNYLRVEFTSKLLRFVDDVEFYFIATTANTTKVQVRSASRVGYGDMGVNRDRIELIRSNLQR